MKEWLTILAEGTVLVIHAMALVVVIFGTLQAFALSVRTMVQGPVAHQFDIGYVRYARWLITGLTFQLAADIIETAVTPTWESIGRLAAIAAIRAFVNFFLERDMAAHERRRTADAE